jgi:hypothetical protein
LVSGRHFPYFRFSGSHVEIGRQIGESCRDLIHQHLDLAVSRLEANAGVSRAAAIGEALMYRPFVQAHARFFDEEIEGLARGAGIELGEAYLLQLRAELAEVRPPAGGEAGDECTSFAVLPAQTSNGIGLVGQNADLPAFYRDIATVLELVFDDMPSVLMLTPAGQVSYLGINNRGLGVFANFLTCDGWRRGFPRYLFSRLALTAECVEDAIRPSQPCRAPHRGI